MQIVSKVWKQEKLGEKEANQTEKNLLKLLKSFQHAVVAQKDKSGRNHGINFNKPVQISRTLRWDLF